MTAALIPHSKICKRPAPVLRLSWRQEPELFCPGCGRSTALPAPVDLDTTTTTDKETTKHDDHLDNLA